MNDCSLTKLYVKQHSVTKLKYFGKTEKDDVNKYMGSGKYWKRHIKDHGREFVETLDIWEFDDLELCSLFATEFSDKNNIVESKEWANLIIEDGLIGGPKGVYRAPPSKEARQKTSKRMMGNSYRKGKPLSDETKLKISLATKGKPKTEEHNRKNSEGLKGKKHTLEHRIKNSEAHIGLYILNKNPNYKSLYLKIENKKTGIKAEGDRLDLMKRFPELTLDGLYYLYHKKNKSHRGWRLIDAK